jgi:hypothetical protein
MNNVEDTEMRIEPVRKFSEKRYPDPEMALTDPRGVYLKWNNQGILPSSVRLQ